MVAPVDVCATGLSAAGHPSGCRNFILAQPNHSAASPRDFSSGHYSPGKAVHSLFSETLTFREAVMTLHSTILIASVLLIGATVPSIAEEGPDRSFTCSAKTFNECLMEAPCSAWKRSGPKEYKLGTKIIFRGNPVEGETISGGTIGDILETKCGKK
jgi:hypothetical protein